MIITLYVYTYMSIWSGTMYMDLAKIIYNFSQIHVCQLKYINIIIYYIHNYVHVH